MSLTQVTRTLFLAATGARSRHGHQCAIDIDSPNGRWLLELPAGVPVSELVSTLLPAQARLDQNRRQLAAFFDSLEKEVLRKAENHGPLIGPIKPPQRPYSEVLDFIAAARAASIE